MTGADKEQVAAGNEAGRRPSPPNLSVMRTLVTGGTGYIGSHTAVRLIEAGHQITIVDNLENSSSVVLDRIASITGTRPDFVRADLRDAEAMDELFAARAFDRVVHFAGLKAVGESVERPLEYYDNNVGGTITLLEAMDRHDVRTIVFSSSATVYGAPRELPVSENAPTGDVANPYGRTKFMIEEILIDLNRADPRWNVVILRYFNPVGAHDSGLIGEDPQGPPNNLMPYIAQVAVGRREQLTIFGDDYDTPDGTGVRDYIHVVDLAEGHIAALDGVASRPGLAIYNLGTGTGTSVRELVDAFERTTGQPVPSVVGPRRPGDVAAVWCDPSRAEAALGWKAGRGIEEMCIDTWRWQEGNPLGYEA